MQLYIWLSSFIITAFNYNACVCLSFFCVFPAPWLIFIQCFWGTLMKSEPQTKILCLCFPAPCFWGTLIKSKPQTKTGCLLCFPTPGMKFTSCGSGFQFRNLVPYLEIRKGRGKGKIPQLFQSLGNLPFRFVFLEPSYTQIKSVNGQR